MARVERAYNMAQDWVLWLDTRRFYAPPEKKNILARLQGGGSSRGEPDARCTAEMVAFNLALTSLPMKLFVPFVVVYCHHKPDPIKVIAHQQGVGQSKFYERAHRAARQSLYIADKLLELNMRLRMELDGLM